MNVCFELFMQDQLKVLKQFEAKVYIIFFPLLCVSPRYLKKCLWLKILSNKIIQVYMQSSL